MISAPTDPRAPLRVVFTAADMQSRPDLRATVETGSLWKAIDALTSPEWTVEHGATGMNHRIVHVVVLRHADHRWATLTYSFPRDDFRADWDTLDLGQRLNTLERLTRNAVADSASLMGLLDHCDCFVNGEEHTVTRDALLTVPGLAGDQVRLMLALA